MPTIWDVAKLAGVSKTTVSRVITKKGSVRPKTYEKVIGAMKELNYSPSLMAQGVRTGKTHTIAVFIPDSKNVYYNMLYTGIERSALNQGYTVMICNTNGKPEREIEYAESMLRRNVDGIIYNTYVRDAHSNGYFMNLSKTVPVVFMNDIVPYNGEYACVLPEEQKSTASAVEYLYRKGCRRIAYLRMPSNVSVVEKRYAGYLDGLAQCGLELDASLVYDCKDYNISFIEIGKQAAEVLIHMEEPPDAILSANDTMAIGSIIYLVKHGYRIPEEVCVIGFDNIEICNIIQPNLTTLAQPTEQMGYEASNMLIRMIEDGISEAKDQRTFEPKLIIRESA